MNLPELTPARHYRTLAAGKIAEQLGADQIAEIRINGKKVGDPEKARQAYLENRTDDPNELARWIDTKAERLSKTATEYLEKFKNDPHFTKSIERLQNRRSAMAFIELMEIDGGVTFDATAEVTLKDGTKKAMPVSVVDVEATLDIVRLTLLGTLPGLIPVIPFVGNIGMGLGTVATGAHALYARAMGDKPKAEFLGHMTKRQAAVTGVGSPPVFGSVAVAAAILASLRAIERLRDETPTVKDIVELGRVEEAS